jgi:hypothetical protein
MQPVVRGHTANADIPAAQNFLSNKRGHNGVINIVIGGVASRDIFKSLLCSTLLDDVARSSGAPEGTAVYCADD